MNTTILVRGMRLTLLLLCGMGQTSCLADEAAQVGWTRFRGDNGTGVVQECNVPLPWTATDVAWRSALPGIGNSSPVVYGDRVFLMSADPNSAERYLLAYSLKSGEEVWRKTFDSQPYTLHVRSSYASGTPCVSDNAVYFAWAAPDNLVLMAFSHDGQELWKRDDLGRYVSQHGFGSSPALFGDLLVLFNSQQAEQLRPNEAPGVSKVMAFNPSTGETVWETPRTSTVACYGTPTFFQDSQTGKDALLFCAKAEGIFALELATGKQLWNQTVFGKRCVSCPIIVDDLAIGTEGSGNGPNILFAVDMKGDKHELAFSIENHAPYVPCPVAKGDLVFLWDDSGFVSCVKTPSGKTLWSMRIGGNVSSSPVIAGDKLMGIADDGTVTILATSENFQQLGSVQLEDTIRSTPLVSKDYLLIRTNQFLICVGKP